MAKIKACPHCGGDANLYGNYSGKARSYFVFVKCNVCGSQGKIYNTPEDPERDNWESLACENAVRVWNMRVGEGATE